MNDTKEERTRTISYNLVTVWQSNESIESQFRSMDPKTQKECIRKYKAILLSNTESWASRLEDQIIKDEQVESIGKELGDSTQLVSTIHKWQTWIDNYSQDSHKVGTRWITQPFEIIVCFEIFPVDWSTNIKWLNRFYQWYTEGSSNTQNILSIEQ